MGCIILLLPLGERNGKVHTKSGRYNVKIGFLKIKHLTWIDYFINMKTIICNQILHLQLLFSCKDF